MRSRRTAATVLAFGLALALAGCGDEDDPTEDATQACDAEQELESAVDEFEQLIGPDATVGEIQQARDRIADAVDRVEETSADVAEDRADAVASAWDDLDSAVDDVESDDTVSDAVDSLRDEAAQVADARQALAEDLACS